MKKIWYFLIITMAIVSVPQNSKGQYPYIRIADVMVTPENQDSIVSNYILGTVRYDSASRTLFLHNATIYRYDSGDPYDDSNGNTVVIEAHSGQTVNIELIGLNTIFGKTPLVLSNGSYSITGAGSLTLNGITEGILCELGVASVCIGSGTSVVIDIPYLPSTGFQGSPQYQDYDQTVLSINSGTLIINADYCIRSIVGFQLNGSHVVYPEGACYNLGDKTLVTDNGPVRNFLEIRPGTVGIPSLANTDWRAWGVDGGIRIEGLSENQTVEVLNILGQTFHNTTSSGTSAFIPLKTGLYLVRVNNHTVKISVNL